MAEAKLQGNGNPNTNPNRNGWLNARPLIFKQASHTHEVRDGQQRKAQARVGRPQVNPGGEIKTQTATMACDKQSEPAICGDKLLGKVTRLDRPALLLLLLLLNTHRMNFPRISRLNWAKTLWEHSRISIHFVVAANCTRHVLSPPPPPHTSPSSC